MPTRKYSAIMFTDIVGFTTMMERSENEAMLVIGKKMQVVRSVVASRGGRLVKEMGDGTLSIFSFAADAVSCAQDIQDSLIEENFKIRVGIHYGSVLFEGNDVFGDTVNVASRLEQKAPGGGILLSREVLLQLKEKERPGTVYMGLARLKGLGRLLQIHFLGLASIYMEKLTEVSPVVKTGPSVLTAFPLVNIGNAEDEFYAYGISADLLSDLSTRNSISIVPLTSLMRSMRTGVSNEEIARNFGSTSFVQGTIQRTGSQMQLSLTLKEVESGRTVWKDTWTEELDDLPSLKSKLADGILKAMGCSHDEYNAFPEAAVESASTYEKYLQALHLWQTKKNKEHIQHSRDLLVDVVSREPGMIPARLILGATYRDSGEFTKGLEIFREAQRIAYTQDNAFDKLKIANSIGVSYWMKGDLEKALNVYTESMKLAIQLDNKEEEARLSNNIGLIHCDRSLFAMSLSELHKSLDISTRLGLKAGKANTLCNIGLVYWKSNHRTKAIEFYRKSLQILKKIDDLAGEANILRNIGIIYNDRGEMEEAYDIAVESMNLSRELDDKPGMCRSLNNMGNAMLALGLTKTADDFYSEALGIARQIGLRNMEGILLTNSTLVSIQLGDMHSAEESCTAALKLCLDVKDRDGIIENNQLAGVIQLAGKDYKKACSFLESALRLSDEYEICRYTSSIRTDLALCLALSANSNSTVQKLLDEAQSTEIADVKSLPDIYWKWSRIYTLISGNPSNSAEQRKAFLNRSAKWKQAARDEILRAAEKIQSDHYKYSFLNHIPLHKTILSAFITETL
ncbi:MAG: tetratricopeptide repeat protein [Candidatus Sabulitectum sp.]|nr:tetratricopeptide repeat protein [Candidatus Sabulitectum sp.]